MGAGGENPFSPPARVPSNEEGRAQEASHCVDYGERPIGGGNTFPPPMELRTRPTRVVENSGNDVRYD